MDTSKNGNPPTCDPIVYSDEMAQTVLDSLSAHIAILDGSGVIMATNRAWREYAIEGGMPADYDDVGKNYLDICETAKNGGDVDGTEVFQGLTSVISGKMSEFLYDYPCHSPQGRRWYYMRAIRMAGEGPLRVVVSHENITALKLTEEALTKSREDMNHRKQSLEEANIALKVLLKHRENDRRELEQRMLTNVKGLVLPYVEKLKRSQLKLREKTLVDIIDTHLKDIISPLLQHLTHARILLTPQEMQVTTLVKDGKSSKEIADILSISVTTVHFHRKNLRKKFGLARTRTNLRSHLLSLS